MGLAFEHLHLRAFQQTPLGEWSTEESFRRYKQNYRTLQYLNNIFGHVLGEGVDRARTALAARRLVESLGAADDASVIALLEGADVPTSEQAMALSMSSAEVVTAALKGLNWNLVDSAERLDGPFALQSSLLRGLINDALAVDEFADRLAPRLAQAAKEATELVDRALHAPALAAMAGTAAPSSDPVPASGSVDQTDRARAAAVLSHLLATVEDTSVGFRFTWTVEELDP